MSTINFIRTYRINDDNGKITFESAVINKNYIVGFNVKDYLYVDYSDEEKTKFGTGFYVGIHLAPNERSNGLESFRCILNHNDDPTKACFFKSYEDAQLMLETIKKYLNS